MKIKPFNNRLSKFAQFLAEHSGNLSEEFSDIAFREEQGIWVDELKPNETIASKANKETEKTA